MSRDGPRVCFASLGARRLPGLPVDPEPPLGPTVVRLLVFVHAERLGQRGACPEQGALHGSRVDTQCRRDLAGVELQVVPQNHRLTLSAGELCQRAFHIEGPVRSRRRILGPCRAAPA